MRCSAVSATLSREEDEVHSLMSLVASVTNIFPALPEGNLKRFGRKLHILACILDREFDRAEPDKLPHDTLRGVAGTMSGTLRHRGQYQVYAGADTVEKSECDIPQHLM